MVTMSSEKVGRRGKGGESSNNQQASTPNHDDNPNHLVYAKASLFTLYFFQIIQFYLAL